MNAKDGASTSTVNYFIEEIRELRDIRLCKCRAVGASKRREVSVDPNNGASAGRRSTRLTGAWD